MAKVGSPKCLPLASPTLPSALWELLYVSGDHHILALSAPVRGSLWTFAAVTVCDCRSICIPDV